MSNLNMHGVTDYATADKFLGRESSKTLCYKTELVRDGLTVDDSIIVIHHNTGIIRYWADGSIEIRNGGYLSSTTTNRLHGMTPSEVRISMAKGGSVSSPEFTADYQPGGWTLVLGATK